MAKSPYLYFEPEKIGRLMNINLVALWRYQTPTRPVGLAFAVFVFIVAAAEVAVGLALILSIYRRRKHIIVEDMDLLKW